ncbi:hypothetical protein EMPS_04256 [Entomortierella parvispora]|uniref:XPG-I domain-containing protein n=1 Tax=Entomortierella parvispora TaxID=205924 RepID=A0A9P3LVA5_9FUNG|nr:hypothetical protein EMPS_03895 [Entomortierella parvispora]GJJ71899.1 hypothetical protein EMPS_04256 [Entomortierella parvispora]
MGVPFLWPFVKKKGYFPDVLSNCPQHSRPPNTTFHVDILGSMYPLIRRTFLKHDPVMANSIFEMKLRSLKFPPATTLLYMDGPSPEEKRATRALREARCSTSLTKADSLLHEMEDMFRQKKKLKKQQFRKLNKGLNAAFYLSADLRESLAQFLIAKGWSVIQCPSEADIQIALNCRTEDIVVSGDSDSLVHLSSITTIWRPLARGGYLEYDVPKLLIHLQLTRAGLTALGVVCRNDYSCNLKQMGIVTNYEVLQSLRDKDPPLDVNELIRAYLTHPEVIIKDPGNSYFDSALKVFARQEFTFWDQTLLPQACYEDTMNQPRSSPSLTEITARLRSLQSQLKTVRSEGSSSNLPVAHTGDIEYKFNRYNTVDSQPAISPSPHASGRKYKYRQRYAIKTRSRIIEHDPPDVLKQYTLKPWTEPPPRPVLPTTTKSSESVTKDPPNFRTMDKMRLVKELQRQHPLRVMDVGTLNANVTRALQRTLLPASHLPRIKTCLSNVARLATATKRACQLAIGQYLETLSMDNLDKNDKLILGMLCKPFVAGDKLPAEGSALEDNEDPGERNELNTTSVEADDEMFKKNKSLQFFLVTSVEHLQLGTSENVTDSKIGCI